MIGIVQEDNDVVYERVFALKFYNEIKLRKCIERVSKVEQSALPPRQNHVIVIKSFCLRSREGGGVGTSSISMV